MFAKNQFHDVLRHVDALPHFGVTKKEMKYNYY